ncbi:DUF4188 domain-containing protein [Streptomyces sp. Ru73]|uniref:DUF4188 domain-containing protein n=1 Tax=Streptomyces sp. Ru73 TaxID=2080748 RepID=UPI000CDD6C0A|nr:DUF4188 domain-containing protein [Streptomyces sp. Ru73]POX43307.1 DUF4188 domain-containing protein [Streptomyces sp. Ru73]
MTRSAPAPERGRTTAAAGGDLVVFVLGMRINRLRAPRHWVPVTKAMAPMIRELLADRDSGLLGARTRLGPPRVVEVIQYWESAEKLLAYASAPDRLHRPAWADFNRRVRESGGSVGVFHETYTVAAGAYEAVYVDMPPYGLGAATGVLPVGTRGDTAAARLGLR